MAVNPCLTNLLTLATAPVPTSPQRMATNRRSTNPRALAANSSPAGPRTMAASPSPDARRAICDRCGARGWLEPGEERTCIECGGPYRPMALLEGLVDRWFAPPAQNVSEFYPRHLKLIEMMWTAEGRGREMYSALELEKVSYSQFVTRANQLVVRGLSEGWIEADLP